ncbi:MAG: hypothetical protein OXG89_09395 [bacterium]|nr:hypothetical protein [bacterium]
MGIHRAGPPTKASGGAPLTHNTVARVIPDVPTLAVDEGFSYLIPESLAGRVGVGSIVRVPLAGRRVRGYVIGLESTSEIEQPDKLKEVRSLSSDLPVFTERMLDALRWAAGYYVAPLARVLAKTAPPNLPKRPPPFVSSEVESVEGPLSELARNALDGKPQKTVQVMAGTGWTDLIRGAAGLLIRSERSVIVVCPTVAETARLSAGLRQGLGDLVVEVGEQSPASVTAAWSKAATTGGLVVVGTMRVVWWPIRNLSMAIMVEEGRPGMKERQSPTVAASDLARVRAECEGFQLVKIGRVPTLRSLHESTEVIRVPGRLWAPVQIVNRTEDPPGQGLLSEQAKSALAGIAGRGGRVFFFTHRRGYAPAARCVRCRLLRSCPRCGSRPDHQATCARCGANLGKCSGCGGTRFEPLGAAVGRVTEDVRRLVGDAVGSVEEARQVLVGTEADLVAVPQVDLAVVVDGDGLVRATNYRAAEDALGLLARVASTVRRNGRARMMLQTADVRQPVYQALHRGDPITFLKDELATRRSLSLPPFGEVVLVEVVGTEDTSILDKVLEDVLVYGPSVENNRLRWMIQGDDLTDFKLDLRDTVAGLRRRNLRVRVDVDPREF